MIENHVHKSCFHLLIHTHAHTQSESQEKNMALARCSCDVISSSRRTSWNRIVPAVKHEILLLTCGVHYDFLLNLGKKKSKVLRGLWWEENTSLLLPLALQVSHEVCQHKCNSQDAVCSGGCISLATLGQNVAVGSYWAPKSILPFCLKKTPTCSGTTLCVGLW